MGDAKDERRVRATDPELLAMGRVARVLDEVGDPDTLTRVLMWVVNRYAPAGFQCSVTTTPAPAPAAGGAP